MKQIILKYLNSYSNDSFKIDRLIVSAYLDSLNISNINNKYINKYIIKKSDADYHDLMQFVEIAPFSDFEQLIEAFEFVISPRDKVVTGAVYTPLFVRKFILNGTMEDLKDSYMTCDPSCGCAGFLYLAAEYIHNRTDLSYKYIFENYIFGLDIQEYSINRSKLLLTLFSITEGEIFDNCKFNLVVGNALDFSWSNVIDDYEGFDCLIGNPPYVSSRHVDLRTKELLKNYEVCKTGRPDLYISFFEIGYKNIKNSGKLGFITMNSFFKSLNGRALREYFVKNECELNIIDFGSLSVFKGTQTYTCICFISKKKSDKIKYAKLDNTKQLHSTSLHLNKISYKELDSYSGWNLLNKNIIDKIESTGTPLSQRFKSRTGVATLKNSVYIFKPYFTDETYYYFKKNSLKYKVEKKLCRDIVNSNLIKENINLEGITKKIIFPYIQNSDSTIIMDEDFLQNTYPKGYNYLLDYKGDLSKRDKGKGNYPAWYSYGRTQCLEKQDLLLFFPHLARSNPNSIICDDSSILFVNGLAFIGSNIREFQLLQRVINSDLFWYYIKNSSREYSSNYYSISKAYFKNFGFYNFNEDEISYIISERDKKKINSFIESKYGVVLKDI